MEKIKETVLLDISKKLTNRYSQLGIKGENLWFPRLMFGNYEEYLHEYPADCMDVKLQIMKFNPDVNYLKDVFTITPSTKAGDIITSTNNLKLPNDIKTKLNYVKSNIKKFCFYKNNDKFVNMVYYYNDKIEKDKPPFGNSDTSYNPTFNIVEDFINVDGKYNVSDREGFRGLNIKYIDTILKDLDFIEKNYLNKNND